MIEIKDLSFGYGKNNVLQNFSACFEKGKLTSMIGTNGSGKSTLLKTIVGILPLNTGGILIDGTELSSLKPQKIAKKISYLAQGKNTPDMTAFQMVLHGRFPHLSYPRRYSQKDRDAAYGAMERMGILGYADKSMVSLSGGMRQNVYIAMALAQDTDYILLDEPTTYLDISHQLHLMKTLRTLAADGKGIITVMHDLPMAFNFSDNIAVVSGGRAAICSSPKEVYNSGIIKDVFGIELNYSQDEENYYYGYNQK